jgi:cobalt/nickel transport system permease protein
VAALLGPAAAVVVLTTVLIVQCFLFADGGVSALGANVFNMALLGTLGGWAVFRTVSRCLPGVRGQVAAVAFAGWCSMVLASLGCAGQLAWSGTVAWSVGFPAMTGIHMLIGLGEGLISALVFLAIVRTRPDLSPGAGPESTAANGSRLLGLGLVASLGLAIFVAPFASPWPDGLEAVAAKLGFAEHARELLLPAPVPDYKMPGIKSPAVAVAVAGAVGTLVMFGLALLLSRALVPGTRSNGRESAQMNESSPNTTTP